MKVKIVSQMIRVKILVVKYPSSGLEYQEDLKIRAANDATARKDQEHLEVTNHFGNYYFISPFI